jgi:hypothetical protein
LTARIKPTLMPAENLFLLSQDFIDSAIDSKGNTMAKSHYQFKKRQKELEKKKKKEEKRLRKLEKKGIDAEGVEGVEGETDETQEDTPPAAEDE